MKGLNGYEHHPVIVDGRPVVYAMTKTASWSHRPPLTHFAHWWQGRSRVFVPGSVR